MKLQFNQDYLSIKKFNEIDLPDLTVITGINGSGKSHLLSAIKKGNVAIANIPISQIALFDYITFRMDNETGYNNQQIMQEKEAAWQIFEQQFKSQFTIQHNYHLKNDYDKLTNLITKYNKSLWNLTEEDISDKELYDKLSNYKEEVKNIINNQSRNNNPVYETILNFMQSLNSSVDDLSKERFFDKYLQHGYKENFLMQNLGKVFLNYAVRYRNAKCNYIEDRADTGQCNKTDIIQFEKNFREINPNPWEIINEILKQFGSVDYEFESPLEDIKNYSTDTTWILKLRSINNPDVAIQFDQLSSGEKILIALVVSIYQAKENSVKPFPKLLLLDEIDASLHPSMIKDLLQVIQEVFIKNHKVKVIIVTHSPTTIVLSPPESVYLMNKKGADRLEKTSINKAMNILSEGFISIIESESHLGIEYNIKNTSQKIILFTEGISDKIIINAAWNKLNTDQGIPFLIQECFSASLLHHLLSRGTDNIFKDYKDKIFIGLFDFDKEGYGHWNINSFSQNIVSCPKTGLLRKHPNHNAYAMLLPVPEVQVIKDQVINSNDTLSHFAESSHLTIELLFYGKPSLEKYYKESQCVGGGKIYKFEGDKVNFANEVAKLEESYFNHFKQIFETIKNLNVAE
jgi:ABC-type uncharacterized transport system ATPase component